MVKQQPEWLYRGRLLRQLEWGLWRDTTRPGYYFICYRPQGRRGPVYRRWACTNELLPLDSLQDHVRRQHAMLNARKLGMPVRSLVASLKTDYLAELRRLNRSESHLVDVTHTLKRFTEFAHVTCCDEIDTHLVGRFLRGLTRGKTEQPASPRTQNKYRDTLYAWFDFGIKQGAFSANPAAAIARTTQETHDKEFPEPEQFIDLVDASTNYDAALWTLFLCTGLRRGSVVRISPSEDIRPHELSVWTKRRHRFHLQYDVGCPLWQPDLTTLARRIWNELPPTAGHIRTAWEKNPVVKAKGYTLHALRHAFVSWLAMIGEDERDIAAWCDHATASTTEQWYTHLRPRGQARLAENRRRVFTARSHCMEKALRGIAEVSA